MERLRARELKMKGSSWTPLAVRSSCAPILQVVPQPVQLGQHKVDVLLGDGLVGDDGPEKVGKLAERLVADHDAARLHHATLGKWKPGQTFGLHLTDTHTHTLRFEIFQAFLKVNGIWPNY